MFLREKQNWAGLFKLLAINNDTCTIELPSAPTDFRSTVVKQYCTDEHTLIPEKENRINDETDLNFDVYDR